MATETFVLNPDLLSAVALKASEKAVDMLAESTPFLQKGRMGTTKGGIMEIDPVVVREHSVSTNLHTGWEKFNLAVQSTNQLQRREVALWGRPVVWSERDKIRFSGPKATYDEWGRRTKLSLSAMKREAHRRVWGSGGVTLADLIPVNGYDFTTGVLEDAAVGAQSNTVYSIARSSYLGVEGLQSQYATAHGKASVYLLAALDAILYASYENIDGVDEREGGRNKLAWYFDTAARRHLKQLVRPAERYIDDNDPGKGVETYGGHPIHTNPHMPTSGTVTSTLPMSIALIDHEWVGYMVEEGYDFQPGDTRSPHDGASYIMPILAAMQTCARYHATSGSVSDAQTF